MTNEGRVLIPLMVSVNGENDGCFKGRVDAISIEHDSEPMIFLQRIDSKGTHFDYIKKGGKFFIKFGRMRIEIHSHKSGVGNWCWDEVEIDAKDAAELLNYLRRQPTWSFEEAWTEFYDKWDTWDEFTEKDFVQVEVDV